ncbi:glucosamine-6-phosphate deaminase [Plantactinospora mayteni]|uniref:Glucosamine-6-phosphate deaminase n=1 Tax=Plantactinospora mayteni TaxID=566021 RepID=A0ABQ4ERK2_9ACTN|nr:6-phosphogluconolactonase [Plantactinospora mayteni]GIG97249.1 glucosamine-6-phosphate deaminase [Plantactinospora mayteni]
MIDPYQPHGTRFSAERVSIHASRHDAGAAAAADAAAAIRSAIEQRGEARVILAAAPSQEPLLDHLVREAGVPWERVHLFHMDEYVGLPSGAPQAFAGWLTRRLAALPILRFEALRPDPDPAAELRRYAELLAAGPIDLACLGVGVNGHLAFNEPGECRLDDPATLRLTDLHLASRQQQVDERLFATLADVPRQAITVTVPGLLNSTRAVLCAFGNAKAAGVRRMLTGPVDESCPASAIRTHPDAQVHLDAAAAALLSETVG